MRTIPQTSPTKAPGVAIARAGRQSPTAGCVSDDRLRRRPLLPQLSFDTKTSSPKPTNPNPAPTKLGELQGTSRRPSTIIRMPWPSSPTSLRRTTIWERHYGSSGNRRKPRSTSARRSNWNQRTSRPIAICRSCCASPRIPNPLPSNRDRIHCVMTSRRFAVETE